MNKIRKKNQLIIHIIYNIYIHKSI